MHVPSKIAVFLTVLLCAALPAAAQELVPLDAIVVHTQPLPEPAEYLALRQFLRTVEQQTGKKLPVTSGKPAEGTTPLYIGNAASLPDLFSEHGWKTEATGDEASQSYVIAAVPTGGMVAAGFGAGTEARAFIGLGYALGDLLRRLENQAGAWGFVAPAEPVIASPAMPNRTLYLMNSNHMNAGISLEYFSPEEVEAYVDFLISARYSRVSLWQWTSNMLYPGNFEESRARNQMTHRVMRHLFEYARLRGLHVFHQLAPMHANVDLLPDDPKYVATGYYGRNSICWAQKEGRELARKMARQEMEYYGPVDGYIVWFYDPGGCFCDYCYPNQAKNLFEQFAMVKELAGTISPEAEFQAVLWPTWCFHEYQTRGIPYKSEEEVQTFVKSFLAQMLTTYGPRNVAIMDTCEFDHSNLYNGLVKPEEFKRTAFMYSIMGLPSESAYPFTAFRLGDLVEVMGRARDRGIEDATFFIQYAATNMPSVFAFADTLYETKTTARDTAIRYARSISKGDAVEVFSDLLLSLDALYEAQTYEEKEQILEEVRTKGLLLKNHPFFFGNGDWLAGQLLAQKHYMGMAQAQSPESFTRHFNALKSEVGGIPMYKDYVDKLTEQLAGSHVATYWRGPLNDASIVGLPAGK